MRGGGVESEDKLRYIAGSILSEGDEKPSEELVKLFEKFGFKIISFPEVTHVVMTSFPFTTFLSLLIAMYRVYPVLNNYIKAAGLSGPSAAVAGFPTCVMMSF
ncbi:hypothetical protein scyTo_0014608 [Scyliorhinus torazame]|uniref:Uncharacterized protein n=1 Tax=Scyliorhinus torazame TaxID=75743 RepID=A0A401NQW2_SCYTO|nr:hypothetical protein [Scyliorhinus torazame]